jgi:hypothetical protein
MINENMTKINTKTSFSDIGRMKTPEQFRQRPNHCPFCDSSQIHAGNTENLNFHSIIQKVSCLFCNAEWNAIYDLFIYQPLKDDDGKEC